MKCVLCVVFQFVFVFLLLTALFLLWQERFQVKNPPHTYLQKLRSYLDPAVTRKVSECPGPNNLIHSPGGSTAVGLSFTSDPESHLQELQLQSHAPVRVVREETVVNEGTIDLRNHCTQSLDNKHRCCPLAHCWRIKGKRFHRPYIKNGFISSHKVKVDQIQPAGL